MDSNGRQRMSSSPGVTLPTSSTFRRLPGIGRGPFRRDKASTPPAVEPNASTSTPTSTHQRGSTYPSNVRLSTDDHISYVPPNHHRNGSPDGVEIMRDGGLNQQSANLSLPSRTSSLPLTPVAPEDLTRFAPPDDLAPITYPSHLAQTRAPDSQSSIPASTSIPIPPLQASTSGRQREFTLGNGTLPLGPVIGDWTRRVDTRERHADGVLAEDTDHANVPHASSSMAKGDPEERVTSKAVDSNAAKKDVEDDGENPPRRRRAATKSSVMPKEDGGHSRKSTATKVIQSSAGPRIPQLPQSKTITGRVPTAAMYFSALPTHGHASEQPLRAHTGTLVRDKIWFLGGVDGKICWRGVAWFDTETLCWSSVETYGERLPPLRAHTTTLVGSRLYIFGGGDGPTYSNDVWTFDTVTHRFSRPNITSSVLPPPRRAHTTILYGHYLVVFGGGNGQAALNDVWALDVSDSSRLTWQEWATSGKVPQKKGYHTANLVGSKMIVFGGSDGHASFADIHVLDLESLVWTLLSTEIQHNRLSHTSTQVGSYLFVVGGHNGSTYAQDVLLFNLVTLQWETKVPKGTPPPGRGYHVATLHDARLFISGGYNGVKVFDDFWVLDLSAAAYLPQVTTFEVDETANMA